MSLLCWNAEYRSWQHTWAKCKSCRRQVQSSRLSSLQLPHIQRQFTFCGSLSFSELEVHFGGEATIGASGDQSVTLECDSTVAADAAIEAVPVNLEPDLPHATAI